MLTLDLTTPVNIEFDQRPDFYSDLDPAPPSEDYDSSMDGMLTFTRPAYDQQTVVSLIQPLPTGSEEEATGFFATLFEFAGDYTFGFLFLLLVLFGVAGSAGYAVRLRNEEDKAYAMDAIVLAQADDEA